MNFKNFVEYINLKKKKLLNIRDFIPIKFKQTSIFTLLTN